MAHKQARATGETLTIFSGTLYRVICPDCEGPQWLKQGIHSCIYCDETFYVGLSLIKNDPAESPEGE